LRPCVIDALKAEVGCAEPELAASSDEAPANAPSGCIRRKTKEPRQQQPRAASGCVRADASATRDVRADRNGIPLASPQSVCKIEVQAV